VTRFSFARVAAVLRKEWMQMRRDRATISMTVALPLIQLFLFGYALNANPRHLPTGVLAADQSNYTRTLEAALANTGYFDIRSFSTEKQANEALASGQVLFVLNIPPGFSRDLDRGEHPQVLMDADATDPMFLLAICRPICNPNPMHCRSRWCFTHAITPRQ
jgi:ABC-2 type transport system permease protein